MDNDRRSSSIAAGYKKYGISKILQHGTIVVHEIGSLGRADGRFGHARSCSTEVRYSDTLFFIALTHICLALNQKNPKSFFYSIATLYNWRYKNLTSLPHIEQLLEYKCANAGFTFNYQLINVCDYNGVGESAPSPYFYQVRKEVRRFEFLTVSQVFVRRILPKPNMPWRFLCICVCSDIRRRKFR